jgi:DMSO reductase anchor subunit
MLGAAVALALAAPISKSAQFTNLLRAGLETGAPMVGLLGVFCSMMIYHDTCRPLWHWRRSLPLFLGTTLALGAAAAAIVRPAPILFAVVIVATSAKLLVEVLALRRVTDRTLTPLKKTALLVTGAFQHIAFTRLLCAMLGGIGLPLLLMLNVFPSAQLVAVLAFGLLLTGELLERFLFFTTVVAPKMPGGLPA